MSKPTREDYARAQRQLKAQQHLVDKLELIRALHVTYYNSTTPLEKTAIEFFYALGDVLEGQSVTELSLNLVKRDDVIQELTET